jgi:hypothetical protein
MKVRAPWQPLWLAVVLISAQDRRWTSQPTVSFPGKISAGGGAKK